MSVGRKLGELQAECARLGLQPVQGSRSKPGKAEYVKALERYYLDKYEAEGTATPCMRWIHENIYSPKLATSETMVDAAWKDNFYADPDVGIQEKFDGCRILLAYDPAQGFGFYSRNRSVTDFLMGNYTDQIWGFERPNFVGTFKHAFILDCEITCDSKEFMLAFGAETQLAAIVACLALNREDSWKMQQKYEGSISFNVFDCVMYDWKSTMHLPYEKRDLIASKFCQRIAEEANK